MKTFCSIYYINRSLFSKNRYMIGVGFKKLVRHPHQFYPQNIPQGLKPSSKIYLLAVPRRYFFSFFLFCVCYALARLFIDALWSPAGKGLTSCFSFVMSNCLFVTFPCGILGQVWYLVVSILDLCPLSYISLLIILFIWFAYFIDYHYHVLPQLCFRLM